MIKKRTKKYQVFVSSTYRDLIDERKEATQAILECGCFPAGMELFPAVSKTQWDLIKSVIDESDYYLIIIAGRYGSLGRDDEGNVVGFTEMEFNYAVMTEKPIIAFIHNSIDSLPSKHVEKTKFQIDRLERFKKKVCTNRMVRFWNNGTDLRASIINSLNYMKENIISGGWVRADDIIENAENDEINQEKEKRISNLVHKFLKVDSELGAIVFFNATREAYGNNSDFVKTVEFAEHLVYLLEKSKERKEDLIISAFEFIKFTTIHGTSLSLFHSEKFLSFFLKFFEIANNESSIIICALNFIPIGCKYSIIRLIPLIDLFACAEEKHDFQLLSSLIKFIDNHYSVLPYDYENGSRSDYQEKALNYLYNYTDKKVLQSCISFLTDKKHSIRLDTLFIDKLLSHLIEPAFKLDINIDNDDICKLIMLGLREEHFDKFCDLFNNHVNIAKKLLENIQLLDEHLIHEDNCFIIEKFKNIRNIVYSWNTIDCSCSIFLYSVLYKMNEYYSVFTYEELLDESFSFDDNLIQKIIREMRWRISDNDFSDFTERDYYTDFCIDMLNKRKPKHPKHDKLIDDIKNEIW